MNIVSVVRLEKIKIRLFRVNKVAARHDATAAVIIGGGGGGGRGGGRGRGDMRIERDIITSIDVIKTLDKQSCSFVGVGERRGG